MNTPLKEVYERFFSYITDDFYMELTTEEADEDCKSLLLSSIPLFEFPEEPLDIETKMEYGEPVEYFKRPLTLEEKNILAYGMVQIWAQRHVTSIEAMRQKFSGPDFKLTSQASHLQRLLKVLEEARVEHRRLQMLHSRRRVVNGKYQTTFDLLVKRK